VARPNHDSPEMACVFAQRARASVVGPPSAQGRTSAARALATPLLLPRQIRPVAGRRALPRAAQRPARLSCGTAESVSARRAAGVYQREAGGRNCRPERLQSPLITPSIPSLS
jgi:hypothetical protein